MLSNVLGFLADQPLLLLFTLLGLGAALGDIRIAGVRIGPAAVLFTAIAIGALASHHDQELQIHAMVGTLGLVMFTYCVGIQNGPDFFSRLRSALGLMLLAVVVLGIAAVAAVLVGGQLGLTRAMIAGTFAGATTNTPALAQAIEVAGDQADPTVGYSVAYIFGVIGVLAICALALRSKRSDDSQAAPLSVTTIEVDHAGVTVAELTELTGGRVTFSRIKRAADGSIRVATPTELVTQGDLLTVIGPSDLLHQVTSEIGRPADEQLQSDQRVLAVRRITLSEPIFEGQPLRSLALPERYHAVVTRVRRGDTDMMASSSLVLQPGDRLRVVAPRSQMVRISRFLGDSSRGMADVNPIGIGVGIGLGILVGAISIPGLGGGFQIGAAAGTLLVGLVFGRLGRVGPVVISMSHNAASTLSQFGLLIFLAWAGVQAGGQFLVAVRSDLGIRIFVLGVVVTLLSCGGMLAVGRLVRGVGPARQAGLIAGTQTQPAALAFASDRTGHDVRVGLGYATVYPAAMIAKILIAHVIVMV